MAACLPRRISYLVCGDNGPSLLLDEETDLGSGSQRSTETCNTDLWFSW